MKLRTKLGILLVVVVVITGASIGILIMGKSGEVFATYLNEIHANENIKWSHYFAEYYDTHNQSFDGLPKDGPLEYGDNGTSSTLASVVLVDPAGYILYHPQGFKEAHAHTNLTARGYPVMDGENIIGYLLPLDYFTPRYWVLEKNFTTTLNLSVLQGIVAASLLAIVFGLIVSERLTRPLNDLSEYVRHMNQREKEEVLNVSGEDEIAELSRTFLHMEAEQERQQTLREQLFCDIGHELRTPLTIMAGRFENKLASNESLSVEEIAALYDEVILLSELVKDLNALARIESGTFQVAKSFFDIHDFLEDFKLLMVAQAEALHIRLVVNVVEPLLYCYADPLRLKQVLMNLISNAFRYTMAGDSVGLFIWNDETDFYFVIADTGIGMTDEERNNVFERFYRADSSRDRATGGSGLGLAISKGIIDAMDGEISVHGKKDLGTTFIIRLPLYPIEAE